MNIRVNHFWQDTSGRSVDVGDYDIRDKRLHGRGQYLVNNGHATVIDVDIVDNEAETTSTVPTHVDHSFTDGALELMDLTKVSENDIINFYADTDIERFQKPDVQAYLDNLDD